MKILKKILLISCSVIILFLAGAGGIVLYYYHHPSRIKDLVEKTLAGSAGVPCSIQQLSYSLNPLHVRAGGITLKPRQDMPGFHLQLSSLQADMTLEGPFGGKTLVLNKLTLEGLIIRMSQELDMPKMSSGKGGGSFLRAT